MRKSGILPVLLLAIAILAGSSLAENENSESGISLQQAIKIGLENSPLIKSGLARLAASRGRFWSGVSLPAPELSITNEYIPVGMGLQEVGEKTVGVSQSFEFPAVYILKGRKLSAEQAIAQQEFELSKLSVISNIKSAYYQSMADKAQFALAQENLILAQDFFDKARIRYATGEATNLERLTAKVQYSEAQNALELQRNRLFATSAKLANAMGFGSDSKTAYQPLDSLSFKPFQFSLDHLLKEAETVHPGLLADRLRIGSASFDKKLAHVNLLPAFSLSYFRQSRDRESGYYGAALGVSVPLWFMFEHKGKIQESAANVALAEADFRSTQNDICFRVKGAFADFCDQEKRIVLYKSDILPQADEIYRAAQKSYEMGEITYVEFMQAKQTRVNSKRNYIDALLSYHLSIVALEEAVGKPLP
jgi:outer membrane protein TolC